MLDDIDAWIQDLSLRQLQVQFVAGNADAAMKMLRTEWGYMLYTNLSVQSTMLEGYTTNSSLGYRGPYGYNFDPAYTSHAHGWSTAPTSTLTIFVVGLSVTTVNGRTWSVAPHLSGLSAAQGGFSTKLGWFEVKWNSTGSSGGVVQLETPLELGRSYCPLSGKAGGCKSMGLPLSWMVMARLSFVEGSIPPQSANC